MNRRTFTTPSTSYHSLHKHCSCQTSIVRLPTVYSSLFVKTCLPETRECVPFYDHPSDAFRCNLDNPRVEECKQPPPKEKLKFIRRIAAEPITHKLHHPARSQHPCNYALIPSNILHAQKDVSLSTRTPIPTPAPTTATAEASTHPSPNSPRNPSTGATSLPRISPTRRSAPATPSPLAPTPRRDR